jgi:hypothetical protein
MANRHANLPADGRGSLRSKNVTERKSNRACDVLHQCKQHGPFAWSDKEDWKDPALAIFDWRENDNEWLKHIDEEEQTYWVDSREPP